MIYEWFDKNGFLSKEIPTECVMACSHSGDCYHDVITWVAKLRFQVPPDKARMYLKKFGEWDDCLDCDHSTLNERVLWLACNDIKEDGEWFGVIEQENGI